MVLTANVEGHHQTGQQQHRNQLHRQHIGPEQGNPHRLGIYGAPIGETALQGTNRIQHHRQQDQRQQRRTDPYAGPQPGPFLLDHRVTQVEHHHHEDKQHHDGTGVDDDLQRPGKVSTEGEEHRRHRQQRDDQIQQRMHRIGVGDHADRRQHGYQRRSVKGKFHARLLRATDL